jgi:hypothetical protein
MPVLVLPTRDSVQVQHDVYVVFGADIDDSIKKLKSRILDNVRIIIVHKVPIVKWHTEAVEAKRGEEFGICLSDEIVKEPRKKEFSILLAKDL